MKKLKINKALLWEYNFETFNFETGYPIVIERVIQRGDVIDWREIVQNYGKEKILEISNWSKQLNAKDRNFVKIFLESPLLYAL